MKGIIADVRGNKAVLLSDQGAFYTIQNQNYEIGQKINYQPRIRRHLITTAACFLLIMLFSLTGYSYYYTPVSYMSIDINPSLQLEINRLNKVIKLKPFNEDAENLVKSISKSQDINQTIDLIIARSKDLGYLTDENNYVAVDILSDNQKLLDQVNQSIRKYHEEAIEVAIDYAKSDELNLSKEYDISLGRAKAVMEYSEVFGGDIKENVDQLSLVPVKEIKKTVFNQKASHSENRKRSEQVDNALKERPKTEKKDSNKEEEKIEKEAEKAEKKEKEAEKAEKKEERQQKQDIKDEERIDKKQDGIKENKKGNKNGSSQKENKQRKNAIP